MDEIMITLKCWLESSFVGIGPVDQSPQTPTIDRNFSAQQQQQISRLASNSAHVNGVGPQIPMLALPMERPSPGSATLEDVLASLLGLPAEPSNRSSSGVTGNNVKEAGSRENLLSVESVPLRRHSEGDAAKKKCSATDPRRVSLDSSDVSGGGPSRGTEMIKCRYHKCESTATVAEAKKHYKSCHNCSHLYCSRECRRAHWERHRRTCLHLRLSSLCRQVLSACRDEPDTLRNLSLLAKRGYLSQGRGVVRILFRSPESAEKFCKQGFPHIGETTYVRWQDLTPTEMGPELYSELLRLAGEYRVETKMLIYVAICVVSEAPGPAATAAPVKWERQLVSRCAKLKICKTVLSDLANLKPAIHRPDEDMDILILTFNGVRRGSTSQNRELLLHNVQGILKQRGVNLRKNYPDVFQRLNTFVDGTSERFLPVTLHPKDSTTGRTFVCIIMPHSGDPEQLKLPNSDAGSHVQVVNVSLEHLDQLTAPAK
ncbi:LOC108014264 [Sergentomyia squamirostris]